jgi:hypothetical protein
LKKIKENWDGRKGACIMFIEAKKLPEAGFQHKEYSM